ncbi:hypothetical protein CVT91_04930 [Candidatus Atribacteria bacterium HGW-Atribacteria-1]|nr:MAG: hypothetical protein CVT91_04930 [Candidatus Atribacteria bacterium HGW-Atribacteria-1]
MAFLVGTAQIEITPVSSVYLAGYDIRKKPSQGVHDNLYAKSIYIENNKEKVALVSLDLVGLPLNIVNKIRKAVKEDVNLDNVVITCTHTHSGPNTISKIGVKKVNVFHIGKNRRGNKEEVDPELGIIKIQDLKGIITIKAIFLNFTCHGTVLDANNLLISADYPAYIYKFLSEVYPDAIILFTNGAAGDINIGYSADDSALGEKMDIRTFKNAEKIGKKICNKVVSVINDIPINNKELLVYKKKIIKLPFKTQLPQKHELEEQIKKRQDSIGKITDKSKKKKLQIRQIYDEIILEKMRSQYNNSGFLNTEIDILRINDAILVTVPGELFCKFGLKIKRILSPKIAMIVGYANDYISYIPTKEAFSRGGYEVETSLFTNEVGTILINEVETLVKE